MNVKSTTVNGHFSQCTEASSDAVSQGLSLKLVTSNLFVNDLEVNTGGQVYGSLQTIE